MVAWVGQSMTLAGAAAATMWLSRRFCRSTLPAACIAGPHPLSQCSRSGIAQRTFLTGKNTSKCPLISHSLPLFSKSVLIPGFRVSKVGALGSSSFSSSASAVHPEDVLKFWFKDIGPESGVYGRKEWFRGGPDFDAQCENEFGECLKLASTGELNGWLKTARGRLALVIILDQITRNVYRNSASSYSQDQTAIKITLETIEQGLDKELTPTERRFLYMPLMHSEDLRDHEIVDRLFENLATESSDNEELHENLIAALEFERKHCAVLKKFGRYPTRNAVLGRPSTKEEEEYLANGGGW